MFISFWLWPRLALNPSSNKVNCICVFWKSQFDPWLRDLSCHIYLALIYNELLDLLASRLLFQKHLKDHILTHFFVCIDMSNEKKLMEHHHQLSSKLLEFFDNILIFSFNFLLKLHYWKLDPKFDSPEYYELLLCYHSISWISLGSIFFRKEKKLSYLFTSIGRKKHLRIWWLLFLFWNQNRSIH